MAHRTLGNQRGYLSDVASSATMFSSDSTSVTSMCRARIF